MESTNPRYIDVAIIEMIRGRLTDVDSFVDVMKRTGQNNGQKVSYRTLTTSYIISVLEEFAWGREGERFDDIYKKNRIDVNTYQIILFNIFMTVINSISIQEHVCRTTESTHIISLDLRDNDSFDTIDITRVPFLKCGLMVLVIKSSVFNTETIECNERQTVLGVSLTPRLNHGTKNVRVLIASVQNPSHPPQNTFLGFFEDALKITCINNLTGVNNTTISPTDPPEWIDSSRVMQHYIITMEWAQYPTSPFYGFALKHIHRHHAHKKLIFKDDFNENINEYRVKKLIPTDVEYIMRTDRAFVPFMYKSSTVFNEDMNQKKPITQGILGDYDELLKRAWIKKTTGPGTLEIGNKPLTNEVIKIDMLHCCDFQGGLLQDPTVKKHLSDTMSVAHKIRTIYEKEAPKSISDLLRSMDDSNKKDISKHPARWTTLTDLIYFEREHNNDIGAEFKGLKEVYTDLLLRGVVFVSLFVVLDFENLKRVFKDIENHITQLYTPKGPEFNKEGIYILNPIVMYEFEYTYPTGDPNKQTIPIYPVRTTYPVDLLNKPSIQIVRDVPIPSIVNLQTEMLRIEMDTFENYVLGDDCRDRFFTLGVLFFELTSIEKENTGTLVNLQARTSQDVVNMAIWIAERHSVLFRKTMTGVYVNVGFLKSSKRGKHFPIPVTKIDGMNLRAQIAFSIGRRGDYGHFHKSFTNMVGKMFGLDDIPNSTMGTHVFKQGAEKGTNNIEWIRQYKEFFMSCYPDTGASPLEVIERTLILNDAAASVGVVCPHTEDMRVFSKWRTEVMDRCNTVGVYAFLDAPQIKSPYMGWKHTTPDLPP